MRWGGCVVEHPDAVLFITAGACVVLHPHQTKTPKATSAQTLQHNPSTGTWWTQALMFVRVVELNFSENKLYCTVHASYFHVKPKEPIREISLSKQKLLSGHKFGLLQGGEEITHVLYADTRPTPQSVMSNRCRPQTWSLMWSNAQQSIYFTELAVPQEDAANEAWGRSSEEEAAPNWQPRLNSKAGKPGYAAEA